MNAQLEKLLHRCNEMDITEQLNWLGDASMPYQAQLEYAALCARVGELERERDAYKKIIDDVRAGNYDNAHDITAARKFIFGELGKMPRDNAALAKGAK